MRRGEPVVIIDNTNTQAWEMRPYVLDVRLRVRCFEFALFLTRGTCLHDQGAGEWLLD
jgi:hypothetical protein